MVVFLYSALVNLSTYHYNSFRCLYILFYVYCIHISYAFKYIMFYYKNGGEQFQYISFNFRSAAPNTCVYFALKKVNQFQKADLYSFHRFFLLCLYRTYCLRGRITSNKSNKIVSGLRRVFITKSMRIFRTKHMTTTPTYLE